MAGLRGLIAVRIGHPVIQAGTSMYWSALMANITVSIRSLLSVIRAGGDDSYPYSAGGYRFRNPKSSVESPARGGPRMPLTGAGSSVSPKCNACWPAVRTSSGAWRHSPDFSMRGVSRGLRGK